MKPTSSNTLQFATLSAFVFRCWPLMPNLTSPLKTKLARPGSPPKTARFYRAIKWHGSANPQRREIVTWRAVVFATNVSSATRLALSHWRFITPGVALCFCLVANVAAAGVTAPGTNPHPCVFTAEELANALGQAFQAPLVRPASPPHTTNCVFETARKPGKKLYVYVRGKETQKEFTSLRRIAEMASKQTGKQKFTDFKDVGLGAFSTQDSIRLWDGARALKVAGLKDVLQRDLADAEAEALLKLGEKNLKTR